MSTGAWTTEDLTGNPEDRVPCGCGKDHPTPPTNPEPATELANAVDDLLIGTNHWPTTAGICRQEGEVWPCLRARQVARISAAARAEALAEVRRGRLDAELLTAEAMREGVAEAHQILRADLRSAIELALASPSSGAFTGTYRLGWDAARGAVLALLDPK